uniref:Late embryogenesis abundant protein LEA-2 subgroup domain-containing protein n=1 Tax=Rhizophora mucronata TaxID=61149 RepID=A0A2P2MZY5_RHIMU
MATSSSDATHCNKTVTGYPAPINQVVSGYPAAAAAAAPTHYYAFRPLPPSSVYRPLGSNPYNYSVRPTLFYRMIIFCVAVLSIMTVLALIAYLVLKPHLPEFRVESAAVSQLNATRSELTARWIFTLVVNNPNKKLGIGYDRLEASVFYGGELGLAASQLAPFSQDKKNQSTIEFQLGAINEYVGENVVDRILRSRDRGSVDFGIRVLGWIRFRCGSLRTREHMIRVSCDPIRIAYSLHNGTGTLTGQPEKCEVY